jgi:beta-lactamase class D
MIKNQVPESSVSVDVSRRTRKGKFFHPINIDASIMTAIRKPIKQEEMKKKLFNFVTLALIAAGLNLTSIAESEGAEGKQGVRSACIAKRSSKVIKTTGDYDVQSPLCSAFKVALSLMGFDAGILTDKDSPRWPFKQEHE